MNKTVLKRFLGYLKPYRFVVIMVLIVSFISVVLDVQLPKILGNATTLISNSFIESNYTSVDIAGVFEIGKLLAILYVLAAGLNFLGKYFMSRVSSDIIYRLQKEIDEKFTRLPVRYFDEQSRGDLLSRATNDIQTIDDSFSQVSVQFFTTVLTFIGIIIMMFTISIPLAIVGILGIPLSMFAIGMIGKKSAASFASRQETTGTINGYIEEYYAGHDIVNAFNYEDRSEKAFSQLNDELYEHSWKATFFAGLMQPISRLINNVVYVFVAIIGGFLATGGMITIGGIQAILQYMQNISQPMGEAANMMGLTQSMLAAAERIFELLDAEEMEEETGKPALPEVHGDVTFKHVSFGYTPEVQLMKDLNIDVKAGETVAIVGPTGAGKTTVINLLMRFYDITGGAIEIDGHNIQDYTKESLRSKVGMVLQDTWLFKGTIRENIRYSRQDATDEEVVAAAKQAFADDFIRKLPKGYDTVITEESDNISQGQKQLLTIARAILASPSVFILDEATSNVDTRTEVEIQKAMDHIMTNKTSFVIAHRLSTIRNANKILVMQKGNVVEQGSHDELIAQNGFYAGLYRAQFE
ncbi:ABC transporter ATP-binding protein/permease [Granulicatella adiacens ATCC 49175]|uniref:ABC transporter, ATP-binding protein n=1 Tax=Granulicatella adiacens ATCC 49175 TaxID=638301 RepID=C8NE81_9LACT|nr:ABC transporter ATP-binding protein [Granulicatella adiacens]EEW37982.1 ABC transporter, ATP-binding protein [Granulicatella adiacens ATCC 49175]UAK93885.1 ABC transporter ATP-binding protein/permease [Granulicatella adiacens]UWP38881.1 ABC transporter ATP-binding protein/permease [Granulicatella adiacens ATCC 49175]